MRILVDVDDVLFPWFDKAHAACERAGITNGVTPSQWECFKDYGVTLDEWLAVMETATLDGSLYRGMPYPGAIEALHRLREAGHSLHIVTARGFFQHGDLIRRHTVEWLTDNNVPHDSLTFIKDKTLMRVDIAVDDSLKNVTALRDAGVRTWLVDAPHNRDVVDDLRVSSVAEFADIVLAGVHA
jgi:FMN phosphatase YigB (HAD superfamily)